MSRLTAQELGERVLEAEKKKKLEEERERQGAHQWNLRQRDIIAETLAELLELEELPELSPGPLELPDGTFICGSRTTHAPIIRYRICAQRGCRDHAWWTPIRTLDDLTRGARQNRWCELHRPRPMTELDRAEDRIIRDAVHLGERGSPELQLLVQALLHLAQAFQAGRCS